MKTIISMLAAFILGLAATAIPGGAQAADFSGRWAMSGTILDEGRLVFTATPVCVFQQAGGLLTGTCKGPNALGAANGNVVGRSVSWTADMRPYTAVGAAGTIECSGHLDADGVIRGVMRFSGLPGLTGAFTAQRP